MKSHTCIKCHTNYQDNEEDDYYCEDCLVSKKEIAKEIDSKFASQKNKIRPKSDFEIYNDILKVKRIVTIKDLGIKF